MGKLKFRIQEENVEPATNDDGRKVFGIITIVIIIFWYRASKPPGLRTNTLLT